VLAAIDSAYGTSFLQSPWHRDTLRMPEYLVQPDGTAVPWGDQHTHLVSVGQAGNYASFEAYREVAIALQDPDALSRLKTLGQLDGRHYPIFPWGHWRAPASIPATPRALEPIRVFRGAGLVTLRTEAEHPEDATQVTIWCGGDKVSHQSASCGHFEVWNRGLLFGDSGSYALGATSEQAWIFRRDAGWNTLRIYDAADQSNERLHRVTVGRDGSRDIFESVPLPRDGGQKRIGNGWRTKPLDLTGWRAREEEYRVGRIISATHVDGLSDVRCDLTACYRSYPGAEPWSGRTDRVERYERRFLFAHEYGVLVIADLLVLTDPEHVVAWRAWTREQALVTGHDSALVRRQEQVEYEFGVPRTLKYASADRRYTNDGRATVRMLTGAQNMLVEAQWGFTDGRLYTRGQQLAYKTKPDWHPTDPTKGPAEACGHRMDFVPMRDPTSRLVGIVTTISIGRDVPTVLRAMPDGGQCVEMPTVGRRIVVAGDLTSRIEDMPRGE
jgi:hypothetical protein